MIRLNITTFLFSSAKVTFHYFFFFIQIINKHNNSQFINHVAFQKKQILNKTKKSKLILDLWNGTTVSRSESTSTRHSNYLIYQVSLLCLLPIHSESEIFSIYRVKNRKWPVEKQKIETTDYCSMTLMSLITNI